MHMRVLLSFHNEFSQRIAIVCDICFCYGCFVSHACWMLQSSISFVLSFIGTVTTTNVLAGSCLLHESFLPLYLSFSASYLCLMFVSSPAPSRSTCIVPNPRTKGKRLIQKPINYINNKVHNIITQSCCARVLPNNNKI